MDEANTDPVPSTIAEEVTVESTTDPATAESATDCTDVQNKVSFRLVFVAVSKRSVMFVFSMEPLSQRAKLDSDASRRSKVTALTMHACID